MTIVEIDFLHPRPHRKTLLWFEEHSGDSDRPELFQNYNSCAHTVVKLLPHRVCVEDLDKMQAGKSCYPLECFAAPSDAVPPLKSKSSSIALHSGPCGYTYYTPLASAG
jgi:hypothetical protein